MKRHLWLVILCIQALALNAAQYIEQKPLRDVVKTPVRSYTRNGPADQLPIITWGGDIATIFGNGSATNTAPNSIFAKQGLNFRLVRQDVFTNQLVGYMGGQSPYLRVTLGMLNQAAELLNQDPRTRPVTVYQMTWSSGGDVLVVKSGINSIEDLRGKTIVIQAYGPHLDLLTTILKRGNLSPTDVTIKYVKDITGTDNTPGAAFRQDPNVHAAFVISPDAKELVSGDKAVRGARSLFSTLTANQAIPDVYVCSQEYFESHRGEVEKFVHALLLAEEQVARIMKDPARKPELDRLLPASALMLLDTKDMTEDVKGLYADCTFVGYPGNVKFFNDPTFPRGFLALNSEIQQAFMKLNILKSTVLLEHGVLNYDDLKQGLFNTSMAEAPRFQPEAVAQFVAKKTAAGTLGAAAVVTFEVKFPPNKQTFDAEAYKEDFERVIELATTYAGAIISIEGHSDPTGYVDAAKTNAPDAVLKRIAQSGRNLSLSRAAAVRQAVLDYASNVKKHTLDSSQFGVSGVGFSNPKTGMQNGIPVRPDSEEKFLSNMRAVFRLVPVEAEASVFTPAK